MTVVNSDILHPALIDPWEAALNMGEGIVMAVLTAGSGSFYRNLGAAMAIASDEHWVGAITSGCIEADIALQASDVRANGQIKRIRYGEGSPYFDMKLPCGGSIEVTLFLLEDYLVLQQLSEFRSSRKPVTLRLSSRGRLTLQVLKCTDPNDESLEIIFHPNKRILVFGSGPEALVFTQMLKNISYDYMLFSHEDKTLSSAAYLGISSEKLSDVADLTLSMVDAYTAIALFYHDHSQEPELLKHILETPAFYIGVQGSSKAQSARMLRLKELGVDKINRDRIRGPIGLIPSTRDPHSLAISVLAEITELEKSKFGAAKF